MLAPLPQQNRHRADYRDEIEHEEVSRILSESDENHPARVADCRGTLSDTISLTRLLKDRRDLVPFGR